MGMIFIKNEKDSTSCYYSYKVNKFQQVLSLFTYLHL